MSKKVRFGLMALFVAALVLALAIPAFAEDIYVVKKGPCAIHWLTYDANGEIVARYNVVKGHYVLIRTDSEIEKTCSGVVPYGEDIVLNGTKEPLLTYDEMCDYYHVNSCKQDDQLIVTYRNVHIENQIRDPITDEVYSTKDWTLTAEPTGEFELVTKYVFP